MTPTELQKKEEQKVDEALVKIPVKAGPLHARNGQGVRIGIVPLLELVTCSHVFSS